ncbi:hypothetical protein ACHAPJ_008944 [Fusarium lateritium]
MNFGDALKDKMGECDKDTTFEILDYFYGHGGNFIDTSNSYQAGQSEMWLGEWMAARKIRDEIVLATKYSGVSRHGPEVGLKTNFGGNGSKSMRLSLEESLRRLQTSYVSIFYLHWWDYATSIEELMHSLNDLVSSGKVLYLVAKANQYARSNGLRQFSVYQGMWNAGLRDFERDILPMCREEGMAICPYGVLGQGRFQTQSAYEERQKNNPGRQNAPLSQHDINVSRVLEKVAKAKGGDTGILHIALAYVMQKAPNVFPIVGGRTVDHIKGNIAGLSVALTEEDIEEIESAYRFDPGFPHTFLSGSLLKGHDATPKGAYNPGDVWYVATQGKVDFVEPQKPIRPNQG